MTQPHVIARAQPEAISHLRIERLLRPRLAVTGLSSNYVLLLRSVISTEEGNPWRFTFTA